MRESKLTGKKRKPDRGETSFFSFVLAVFGSHHRQRPCPQSTVKNMFCSFLSFAVFRIRSFVLEFLLRFRDTSLLNDSIYVTGWRSSLTHPCHSRSHLYLHLNKIKKKINAGRSRVSVRQRTLLASAMCVCNWFLFRLLFSLSTPSSSSLSHFAPHPLRCTLRTTPHTLHDIYYTIHTNTVCSVRVFLFILRLMVFWWMSAVAAAAATPAAVTTENRIRLGQG